MEVMYTFLVIFVILLALGGLVAFIVYVVRNKNFSLGLKSLFKVYLYLLSFITLAIAVFGASLFLKSALSYMFGPEFSYRGGYYSDYSSPDYKTVDMNSTRYETVNYKGETYKIDLYQRKNDLVNGITLLASMAILFGIHQFILGYTENKDTLTAMRKIYVFVSLTLYSIVSIIAIPTTIYQVLSYTLLEDISTSYYNRPLPGEPLSIAIAAIPAWLYFLYVILHLKNQEEITVSETPVEKAPVKSKAKVKAEKK